MAPRATKNGGDPWIVYDGPTVHAFSMRVKVGEPVTVSESTSLLLCLGGTLFLAARCRRKH